jgi:hypothetical protein
MDRQTEIRMALSACPKSIADGAGVYVLESSGYVRARDSRNGFTAIVQHSVPGAQEPQCIDAEGSRTILPKYLMVASLRAQGKAPDEVRRAVADAFARGILQPPARTGVDYMLSTENLVSNPQGVVSHFPPHLMFYGPFLTNADLGVGKEVGPNGNPMGPVFVAGEGTPQALIIVPLGAGAGHVHPTSDPSNPSLQPHPSYKEREPSL